MMTPVGRSTRIRPPAQAKELRRPEEGEEAEHHPQGDAGALAQEEGARQSLDHDMIDGQRAVRQLVLGPCVHELPGGPQLAVQDRHVVVQRGQEVSAAATRHALIVAALDEGARQFVEGALPIRNASREVLAKCDESQDLPRVAALCAWRQPQV